MEETSRYLESIFRIREKAARTEEEVGAASFVRDTFAAAGLSNFHLESFNVTCRKYKTVALKSIEPFEKEIPCVMAGTNPSTSEDDLSAELFDAGYGTLGNHETLKARGDEVEDEFALIEGSDKLAYWPDAPCRLANHFWVRAAARTSFVPERIAFRKEAFPFPPIPAMFASYEEAQQLRRLLLETKLLVNLRNLVQIDEEGVSYNVVGDLFGNAHK